MDGGNTSNLSGDKSFAHVDIGGITSGDLKFGFGDFRVDQMSGFRSDIGESFLSIDFSGAFDLILEPPVVEAITRAVSSFDITGEASSISTETAVNSIQTFVTLQVFANLINGVVNQIGFAFLGIFKIILVIMNFDGFNSSVSFQYIILNDVFFGMGFSGRAIDQKSKRRMTDRVSGGSRR